MNLFKTQTQKRIAAQAKAAKENAKRAKKFNAKYLDSGFTGLMEMCRLAPVGKVQFQAEPKKQRIRPCKHYRYLQRYR